MPRLTVTISEEHERILEEKSDVAGAYKSKGEVVRECIESHDRVEDLANQVACLEAEVNMLREQREKLKQKSARVEELEEKLWELQMDYQELIHEEQSKSNVNKEQTVDPRPEAGRKLMFEEKEDDSSVFIDEELAYKRSGVGTRLKSAILGGPNRNR